MALTLPPSSPTPPLTDEQQAVVHHDPTLHATVLAVAGAGKTTAMVHRIRHLVLDQRVPPAAVRAVMFNRAARQDFENKLAAVGVRGVRVQTFNALGHAIVGWAARQGLGEALTLLEEWEELRLVDQAIRELRRAGGDGEPVDAEDAAAAIRSWKALLTPPDHARCTGRPELVEVYRTFERLRRRAKRMTFDDQIGEAVRVIEGSPVAQRTLVDRLDHLIIDEFQDVNHAQQRLAMLIAGKRARVMVVGDDDQCIYEWRGARSAYIKRVFRDAFTAHRHQEYRLTRSFRFGPAIARVAANGVSHNVDRVPKALVAADPLAVGEVRVVEGDLSGVIRERLAAGMAPGRMVVLVRLYAQSYALQARLIATTVPFFVEGERSLLDALPVRVLRAYLWLASRAREALDGDAVEALELVVDKPTRYVKKQAFGQVLQRSLAAGASVVQCLQDRFAFMAADVSASAADALGDLADVFNEAGRKVSAAEAAAVIRASVDLGAWLAEWLSEEKAAAGEAMLAAFVDLLAARAVPLAGVEAFARGYDTRQGQPEELCLRITSIFRAKGLEWDEVLLPELVEGACPCLRDDEAEVENSLHPERALARTEAIEAERRLFYVAVTRARHAVWLGVPTAAAVAAAGAAAGAKAGAAAGAKADAKAAAGARASAKADAGARDKPSRFIEEALVGPTMRAVGVIQGAARAGAVAPAAVEAMRAAAKHDALHAALPGLLARTQAVAPGAEAALQRLGEAVTSVQPGELASGVRVRRAAAGGVKDRGG